ncbi:alkaline shock response membrane anchor protein AmaP [Nocardiopsis ansamitocini]|uniref:Alkaline shock response membrane anchor protein AmaP n=1 Tax=Nocardiopsis ansamitocini TaxID=1670832 RepID=A0A9W6P5X3_9ACTN|nr:alkaline shock response membrane anchor protein AmaP [Nocardiopsis ansamitocini]GLU47638.1 hypothetical protein Nans01_19890 [Nocardiopsis ansamitocini]
MTVGKKARKSARGNRWGLAFVGLLLLAAGAAALAAGLGAFGTGVAGSPLLTDSAARYTRASWVPYAVVALSVVLALIALRWLVVQGRVDWVGRLRMEPEPLMGTTELTAGAARGVFEEEVGEYPGVRRARVKMTESSSSPHLRLDLTLNADADATAVWRRVRGEALENLRSSLELDRLPAVVRMTMTAPAKNPARELV